MDGRLAGWVTLMRLQADATRVQVGLVVREGWRDKGLGTALLCHARRYKDHFHGPRVAGIVFTTLSTNARMHRVAAKIGATRGDTPLPGGEPGTGLDLFSA